MSGCFTISNGVRQGGILSPKLFSQIMNPLTDKLIACNSGCYINDSYLKSHIKAYNDKYFLSHVKKKIAKIIQSNEIIYRLQK